MNKLLSFINKKKIKLLVLFLFPITFLLLLLFPRKILYTNHGTNMKITLVPYVSKIKEGKSIVIYNGDLDYKLLGKLKKARPAILIEKRSIPEGCYIVEFFDGKEEKKYSIKNNYWIYDDNKEKFLRCSMLNILRDHLLDYIFDNGYSF